MSAGSAVPAAQTPDWHVDAGATLLREAWDHNEAKEGLVGALVGIDRRLWRAITVRVEGTALRVSQQPEPAWMSGVTIGTRFRAASSRRRPFADLAVGLSAATDEVPPRGTASNYLIVAGAGLGLPVGRRSMDVSARWFHVSNNGKSGRHRNPDIQALGVVITIGWER